MGVQLKETNPEPITPPKEIMAAVVTSTSPDVDGGIIVRKHSSHDHDHAVVFGDGRCHGGHQDNLLPDGWDQIGYIRVSTDDARDFAYAIIAICDAQDKQQ